MEYSFTHCKQEIGNFFFFFHYFSIIFTHFSKKRFFGPFSRFYAPPWSTPHPLWPKFVPPHPLSPTNPKMILRIKIIHDFWIFLVKLSFLPFLSILAPEDPPPKGRTKKIGALGSLLRVPSPPPDPILSTKSQHHILFLPGASSCTRYCSTLPWLL